MDRVTVHSTLLLQGYYCIPLFYLSLAKQICNWITTYHNKNLHFNNENNSTYVGRGKVLEGNVCIIMYV